MKIKECSVCLIIIFFAACHPKNAETRRITREWQHKEIKIPNEIHYKVSGRDTVCTYLSDKSCKVLTYIDSVGCIGCQFDLYEWKRLMESCDDSVVNFVFVVCASDYEFLEQAFKEFNFNIPVIYDYHDDFNKLNHFPPAPYRTFLLDKDNKVVLIGSPTHNPKIWELYKRTITHQSNSY